MINGMIVIEKENIYSTFSFSITIYYIVQILNDILYIKSNYRGIYNNISQ